MSKFKNDRILLLRVLRDLVTENMDFGIVNSYIESDVADLISEIVDKKRIRRLKKVRKELDEMIEEMIIEEKLRKQERLCNESRFKEVTAIIDRN